MGRANTERQPTLQERFLDGSSERGSIRSKLVIVLGSATLTGVVFGSLGLAEYSLNHPVVQDEVVTSAGKGMLTAVQSLDVPESCYGVYQNDVKGAKATFERKINLFGKEINTSYSASSTFNGNITSKVCNDSMSLALSYDKPTNKYELTVPASAFHTDVYRTNPGVNAFTTDNGALMALQKNVENDINALPKLESHKSDGLMGTLNGYAELAAFKTAAEACGPKAWLYLEPLYKISLQKQLVAEANRWAPEDNLTTDDINVTVTGEVHFTNQYDDQLTKIKSEAEKHGTSFVSPNPNTQVCTVSPDLQDMLDKLAGTAR